MIAPGPIRDDDEPFEVRTYHFVPDNGWADTTDVLTTDAT